MACSAVRNSSHYTRPGGDRGRTTKRETKWELDAQAPSRQSTFYALHLLIKGSPRLPQPESQFLALAKLRQIQFFGARQIQHLHALAFADIL